MARHELLDKLAMELAEWPESPETAGRKWEIDGFAWQLCFGGYGPEVAIARGKEYEFEGIREHHWRDRRAELINKPSWDSAPEWATHLCQNGEGRWKWYPQEPYASELCGGLWCHNANRFSPCRPNRMATRGAIPAGHDWRQTLEKRPLSHRLASEGGSPCMDCGTTDSVHTSNCPSHEWDQGERRMDAIGRNGEAETRHDCNRCGGSYYTPPHDECPCSKEAAAPSFEGLKFDTDKPRMELLIQGMPRALEAVGQVLTFGANKYAAHNWKLVDGAEDRYWAAKCRHELSRARGEDKDPETGLLHLAHEVTNALFLLELALANQAEDKP